VAAQKVINFVCDSGWKSAIILFGHATDAGAKLTYILDAERVRLGLLALVVPVAHVSRVLPPLVIQNLNHTLLLQLENRQ
jgi:hypothetical protein